MTRAKLLIAVLLAFALTPAAFAQSSANRSQTWEFLFDLNYQDAYNIDFEGGSTANTDSDLGFSMGASYNYNNRLQFQFLFDWMRIDYDATIQPGVGNSNSSVGVRGEMETFTPRFNAVFNLMEGNFSPYVSAGVGWSFIDTNIPTGPPQTGCWWDPWYGQICTTWQNTRSSDEFAYQAGVGVRWDVNRGFAARLGYEKQWIDVGTATSTPGFDVVRLEFAYKY